VDVTFDPSANPQWKFVPENVSMGSSGKVICHRRPPTATWTFTGGDVKKDPLNEFSSSVEGNGKSLHIDDKFYDKAKTEYEYYVTVELDGTSYTSPDPKIVNDPGGGGVSGG
jgi:hypothetical protein